ncbi:metal-dependent hydrolase [Moraxella nasovis]|uniref:metal-dependent hydrolase n=1 Tax=Moraxella nasovis TaxID=2904121 RepID=UPI001F61FF2B|nr:metal-dependent hydrolase [Moraxella nasovis]UNU72655.1 metal-dependent hydrolase [Moraxella nasovis]
MANFRTHLTVALATSSTLAVIGMYIKLFGATTAILCAIIGTVGGLLPDIDLDHSAPAKRGFLLASLIVSTIIVILYANTYRQDELVLDSLILWGLSFVLIRFVLLETFSRLTHHRGMVHSVPYMAVFGLIITCGAFYGLHLTAFISWAFGVFLLVGAMIHLALDEIYSVNVLGLRLKRSAGTAFKFFEVKKPLQYALLYAVLIGLFFIAPPYQDMWRVIKKIVSS